MTIKTTKNGDLNRYEIFLEDKLGGFVDYLIQNNEVVITHTEISTSLRSKGLASKLVKFALEDIRAEEKKVIPQCWYVELFLKRHLEYQDLQSPNSPSSQQKLKEGG